MTIATRDLLEVTMMCNTNFKWLLIGQKGQPYKKCAQTHSDGPECDTDIFFTLWELIIDSRDESLKFIIKIVNYKRNTNLKWLPTGHRGNPTRNVQARSGGPECDRGRSPSLHISKFNLLPLHALQYSN